MSDQGDFDGDNLSKNVLRELLGQSEIVSLSQAKDSSQFVTSLSLYDMWHQLPGDPPQHSQFSLSALDPTLLPKMVVMDVLGGGEDYRFRFYGSRHVAHFGGDLTGLTTSDVETANPATNIIRQLYDHVLAKRDAVFFRLNYLNRTDVVKRATGVMMPLADSKGTITRLIGGMDWFRS